MGNLQSRINKLEKLISVKHQNNDVNIYIPLNDKEVLANNKVISMKEYQEEQKTWTEKDIIINVRVEDYDELV